MLKEGGSWELAPAYDVTFAHNPKGEWTSRHQMSIEGKFTGITSDDLLKVADRFGIGTARKIINQVAAAAKAWPEFAREAGISGKETARIKQFLTEL